MKDSNFQVLLYYKYIAIDNPEEVRDQQRKLCEKLDLKGRILIAKEGINGTVEGTNSATEAYIKAMDESKYFQNIYYKKSFGDGKTFPKLVVKARSEIVTAGMPDLSPTKVTGKYLSAEELHQWFTEKRKFYIVDMRNDFEYSVGYFEGFIPSGMKHFRYLKDVLPKLKHLKDKTIVTVCTGGIRCEKASGFLVENGFTDVYQLKEGIQNYMEKYPNQHFKGKLYVFDGRVTIGFNTDSKEHEIVGKCSKCGELSEHFVNCLFDDCHKHFIRCENCRDSETGFYFCDESCKKNYLSKKSSSVASL